VAATKFGYVPAIILSQIIICGVETIEQHTVETAEDRKSIPGPKLR
jgi:hypothetical protein